MSCSSVAVRWRPPPSVKAANHPQSKVIQFCEYQPYGTCPQSRPISLHRMTATKSFGRPGTESGGRFVESVISRVRELLWFCEASTIYKQQIETKNMPFGNRSTATRNCNKVPPRKDAWIKWQRWLYTHAPNSNRVRWLRSAVKMSNCVSLQKSGIASCLSPCLFIAVIIAVFTAVFTAVFIRVNRLRLRGTVIMVPMGLRRYLAVNKSGMSVSKHILSCLTGMT